MSMTWSNITMSLTKDKEILAWYLLFDGGVYEKV